jgi:hypothetical protein
MLRGNLTSFEPSKHTLTAKRAKIAKNGRVTKNTFALLARFAVKMFSRREAWRSGGRDRGTPERTTIA